MHPEDTRRSYQAAYFSQNRQAAEPNDTSAKRAYFIWCFFSRILNQWGRVIARSESSSDKYLTNAVASVITNLNEHSASTFKFEENTYKRIENKLLISLLIFIPDGAS
ncbi:unnamed protein product [Hymenolepis diminuta]|uniref:Uncharacterized protein n=1 Tax=Hymenolepis diminuta TaxID=6216 RepID=A0A564YVN6_HYMDI|nr:unnamed protein product [Hymenolepis diminuta]